MATKGNRKEKTYDEVIFDETKKISTESSPAKVETAVPQTVKNGIIINALLVNVRERPSFESRVLEVLKKGDKVKILKKGIDFWKVSTKNHSVAYISSKYVTEE